MIKLLIASGVAVSAAVLASPAQSQADWYINPELNASAGLDSGTGGATLETHVGYDFGNGAWSSKQDQHAVLPDTGENEVGRQRQSWLSAVALFTVKFLSAAETNHHLVSRLVPNSASEL